MSDEGLLGFTRSLCDSVRSGLPPAAALRELGQKRSADEVEKGKTLEEALAAQGRFPPIFLALVRAGESSGKLDAFLDRYAEALETRIDFGRRLRRAMTYPAFAGLVAAVVFLLFTVKGLPLLLGPLLEAGAKLPPGALFVVSVGDKVAKDWPLIAAVAGAVLTVLYGLWASRLGRVLRTFCAHWVPGWRYATEEARACDFEATAGLLLGAGLRPHEVVDILAQNSEDDLLVRRRLARAAKMLPEGASLTDCLGPCVPDEDRVRFATAEKAGRLDETLAKLAESHRERHLHRLKSTATAIQLGAVTLLAPASFGLILWILWPALSVMKNATAMPQDGGSAASPALSAPPPLSSAEKAEARKSAEASRFNETHASSLLGWMKDHEAPKEDAGAAERSAPSAEAPKKKWTPPKLQSPQSIQRLQRNRAAPTDIRSGFE